MYPSFFNDELLSEEVQKPQLEPTLPKSAASSRILCKQSQPYYVQSSLEFVKKRGDSSTPIDPLKRHLFGKREDFAGPSPTQKTSQLVVGSKKAGKNSNVIKKIGRIIIKNQDRYRRRGRRNEGVERMMNLIDKKMKNSQAKDIFHVFNTEHLRILFNQCSKQEVSSNLRITQNLFQKHLRREVLYSSQIKCDNQVIYLNTLKCSSLRFSGKTLALRLQL